MALFEYSCVHEHICDCICPNTDCIHHIKNQNLEVIDYDRHYDPHRGAGTGAGNPDTRGRNRKRGAGAPGACSDETR